MLLFYQSITSQTSVTFLFVLNYEFPFVFAISFIPLPFPFPTIPDSISFPMIKYRCRNGRSFSVRLRPFSSLERRHGSRPHIRSAQCLSPSRSASWSQAAIGLQAVLRQSPSLTLSVSPSLSPKRKP